MNTNIHIFTIINMNIIDKLISIQFYYKNLRIR
jgi:hypothetical protein